MHLYCKFICYTDQFWFWWVALLFKDHQDLLEGFTYFLPDSSGSVHVSHGPISTRAAFVPAVCRDERSSGLASRHPHMEKVVFVTPFVLLPHGQQI